MEARSFHLGEELLFEERPEEIRSRRDVSDLPGGDRQPRDRRRRFQLVLTELQLPRHSTDDSARTAIVTAHHRVHPALQPDHQRFDHRTHVCYAETDLLLLIQAGVWATVMIVTSLR